MAEEEQPKEVVEEQKSEEQSSSDKETPIQSDNPVEEEKSEAPSEDIPKPQGRIEEVEQNISKKVKQLSFSVFSPKFVRKMASAKIVTPELYDKEGYPVDGGLMDIRLGVIDPGLKCKTCGSKLKECIGHFGYIELARPIIHIKFVNVVLDVMRCSCRE